MAKQVARPWRGYRGGAQQARQDGGEIEAAIESVLHLSEVAMGVLGEVEGVIGAAQRALEVAEQGVDRLELRQLDARLAAAGDDALVRAIPRLSSKRISLASQVESRIGVRSRQALAASTFP